jgi:hypothetical protein
MSTTFDGDLDLEYGFEDADLIADYDSPYEEEDFDALGINPGSPTVAKPGSEDKVTMLAARYAAGMPLWHTEDCYDHGPTK